MTNTTEGETRQCPLCDAQLLQHSKKCKQCGEWVRCAHCNHARIIDSLTCDNCGLPIDGSKPTPARQAAPQSQRPRVSAAPAVAVVHQHGSGSIMFAVVTLIFYLLLFPVGFVLNLVGLLTGPRRGCFSALLLFFVLLPVGVVLMIVIGGVSVGIPIIDDGATNLVDWVKSLL